MGLTALQPKHFTEYAVIFQAMKKLYDEGKPIDHALLIGELYEKLANIGGPQVLTELSRVEVDTDNFKAYERDLIEQWQLKEIKRLQKVEITNLEQAREIKSKISELTISLDDEEYDHAKEMLDLHREIEEQEPGMSGYDTGFADLNYKLDGLQPNDLIVIAGRPSTGKTAFALNLANNHAVNKGRIAFFSLEMPKRQLQKRMISSIGKISGNKMRNPNVRFVDNDWEMYHKALGVFSNYKLHIYDKSGQTLSDIRSKVQQLRNDYPEDELLVIIDYLQLIRSDATFERKDLEIGEITRSLKGLARDEEIPVVVLSQLSRGVEQRQDKRPMMSDIRDSGSVEQDMDVGIFLYRDDYYDKESDKENIVEVIIAKQRNGPLGTVELYFDKEYSRFLSLAKDYDTQ